MSYKHNHTGCPIRRFSAYHLLLDLLQLYTKIFPVFPFFGVEKDLPVRTIGSEWLILGGCYVIESLLGHSECTDQLHCLSMA